MKSAAAYLPAHVVETRHSRRDRQPVVAYSVAIQAIEAALADAEKYKYLLMRALRHHVDETTAFPLVTASPALVPSDFGPTHFLHPASVRLAA